MSKAKSERLSLSRTVIVLLEECLSGSKKTNADLLHHDLDHLSGSWTAEEAAEFDATLVGQRRIDPELED